MKLLIVGGVAGGASAAARARRLREDAEIIVFERGPYVSFANCGLPYFIGGEITDRKKLLVQTPESLKRRLNIDVRIETEVQEIDPQKKLIKFVHLPSGTKGEESYDALVLATGAMALRPPIVGLDLEGIFVLRTIPDMDKIDAWIKEKNVKQAVVVGGGFIGLEMVEQLHRRGVQLSLVEALSQVLAPLDSEMVGPIHDELKRHGVALYLGDAVSAFEESALGFAGPSVRLKSGRKLDSDLVLFGIGVKPDVQLAKAAGLSIGAKGGIVVDESLQTSDPCIWAVGDCIEVPHKISGARSPVPLAGPANRQGRIAADNIFGRKSRYAGALGTAIVRVFDLTAGVTGLNESALNQQKIDYKVAHIHANSHAGYYPGASPLAIKILFSSTSGKLLGAQAVGGYGIDKRIDVFATALHAGLTVEDLVDLELAYAPPFGSAKDPVNLAGMIGDNMRAEIVRTTSWQELAESNNSLQLLDVRTVAERSKGTIPNSLHIPVDEIRDRLSEIPKDKELVVFCAGGQRSYFACRILQHHGYKCRNLSGAYKTWLASPLGSETRAEGSANRHSA